MRFLSIFLIISLITISCRKSEMNHNELTAFINNPSNNLSKENSIDQLKIKVVYKPNDFIIQRELISKEKFDSDMIDSLREKFGDYYYFNCSMTIDDADLINGSA